MEALLLPAHADCGRALHSITLQGRKRLHAAVSGGLAGGAAAQLNAGATCSSAAKCVCARVTPASGHDAFKKLE